MNAEWVTFRHKNASIYYWAIKFFRYMKTHRIRWFDFHLTTLISDDKIVALELHRLTVSVQWFETRRSFHDPLNAYKLYPVK